MSKFFTTSLAKLNLRNRKVPESMCIGSLLQGIEIICGLLRLLSRSAFSKSTTSVTTIKCCVTFILDHRQRLWNVLVRVLYCNSKAEHRLSLLVEHVFQALKELVLYFSLPQWHSSVRMKVHSLWAQCIAEMVHISQASSLGFMADETISILEITIEISSRDPGFASAVGEILQPTVKAVLNETGVQTITSTRIQVRYMDYEVMI